MPASSRADTEVKSSRGRVKRPSCAETPALAKMRSVVSRRHGLHASLQASRALGVLHRPVAGPASGCNAALCALAHQQSCKQLSSSG